MTEDRQTQDQAIDAFEHNVLQVFALARSGTLGAGEMFQAASSFENVNRFDLAAGLYRAWLSNTEDNASVANVWYNLGIVLLKIQDVFLAEQAFLNSLVLGFEFAANALSAVDFNDQNAAHAFMRSLFAAARAGVLSADYIAMVHERIATKEVSQQFYELYALWLARSKTEMPGAYWFEFGILSTRLNYPKAAERAFQKALQINPDFELVRLVLEAGDELKDLIGRLSLFYSLDTYVAFEAIKAALPYALWSVIYKSWLQNCLGAQAYFTCYQLGGCFLRQGATVEAKWAFERSYQLNPQFERAKFALGQDVAIIDDLDNRALFQALDIQAGRAMNPVLPPKGSDRLTATDRLILKAPHLFRVLVNNRVEVLKHAGFVSSDPYEREKAQDRLKLATNTIANVKRKLASLAEGGTGTMGTGRSAFLFSWYGVGDHIYMNGAVRYLSTLYDKVYVGTTHKPPEGILGMFRDDPCIVWQIYDPDKTETDFRILMQNVVSKTFGKDGFFSFGILDEDPHYEMHYPDTYYDEMQIDPAYAATYCHMEEYPEGEELLRLAQATAEKFIFTHCRGSNRDNTYILAKLRAEQPDTLILNPEVNIYEPGHKFYETAQRFLWPAPTAEMSYPILWYMQTMSHASELHLICSAFWALAHYIPHVEGQKVFCYNHSTYEHYYSGKSVLFDSTYINTLFNSVVFVEGPPNKPYAIPKS